MKTLNEILNESLLDADFDVSAADVYTENIVNKINEITSSHHLKNYDKAVKELYGLLKSAAREQQPRNTSILKRLRTEDNTGIYISKELDVVHLFIWKFIKGSRPFRRYIQLKKQDDGSGLVYVCLPYLAALPTAVTPDMKETMVFLGPKAWDELESFWAKRY